MKITKITPQVKDGDRANIYIDGKFYCGANRLTVSQLELGVGTEVTPEIIQQLQRFKNTAGALESALRNLQLAPKSEKMMREYLTNKWPEEVEETILKLKEMGLIDDLKIAERMVEASAALEKYSKKELYFRMIRKGISKENAIEALEERGEDSELASAQKLISTKVRSWDKLEPQQKRAKAFALLARHGFNYQVVKKVVGELAGEEEV